MPIRILDSNDPLLWTYLHDDAPEALGGPHGGPIDSSLVVYADDPITVGPDFNSIQVPCPYPGCGSASWHPVGGGAAPREVQELFVRLGVRDRALSVDAAIADARARCERMDFVGRWQVDEADLKRRMGQRPCT